MSTEHVIHSSNTFLPPIHLEATCGECWRVFRYEVPLTTVVNQHLADEGWRFPGVKQICPKCVPTAKF